MGMFNLFFRFFRQKINFIASPQNIRSFKRQKLSPQFTSFYVDNGITSENNAILPFFCNFDVENDFYRVFHFLQYITNLCILPIRNFFSLLAYLEDSSYCHNTCIGSRRNSNPMRRILGVDNLSISRINTYMAIIANDISRLCLRIGYCVSRTSLC